MNTILEKENFLVLSNTKAECKISKMSDCEYKVNANWSIDNEENPQLVFELDIPCVDFEFAWQPTCLLTRTLNLKFYSTLTSSAPLLSYCNNNGNSAYTLALSETRKRVDFDFTLIEETARVKGKIIINLKQFINVNEYEFFIYIDKDEKPLYESCANVLKWWDEKCEIEESYVPKEAKLPMYSTWYSFHQLFNAEEIEKECAIAKSLGMEAVIVDDGWQTDDVARLYAYTGDWEICKSKIPDMREHVKKVHEIGMKYILWYSVPFVGIKSSNWDRFKYKILSYDKRRMCGTLDPRFPDVREFLINTYKRAVIDWDLDGFKLDFIDEFAFGDNFNLSDDMDYACVQEATERLMIDIKNELLKLKPNMLIEFRYEYIGPHMRKFGNMFRVLDTPNNYRLNRVGAADLRMLSGNMAVHSDMLMWNENETPQNAALQILNVIFSVIQFSMKIEKLPEEHLKMSKFWLDFANKNQKLLLESNFEAYEPQSFYPVIKCSNDNEELFAIYQIDKVITLKNKKKIMIINATKSDNVIIDSMITGNFKCKSYDCMGNMVSESKVSIDNNLIKLKAEKSGLLILTQED